MSNVWMIRAAVIAVVGFAMPALAQPVSVVHVPGGGLPTGGLNPPNPFAGATTARSPATPREDETVRIYFRVACQFGYDRVALYYTTDGSEPQGAFGAPGNASTSVLTNAAGTVAFVANDFNHTGGGGCVEDWWLATLPAGTRSYQQQIRYKVSAWRVGVGPEVVNPTTFTYTNLLAWPGQGSNFPGAEGLGYPPVWTWKEEGVVGNNFINAMLDQNGSIFDVYFPGAGGVQGVGTKNEGYVDGLDTFPPGLPLNNRGQMHINQVLIGLRVDGVTSWLSNQNGTDFVEVEQRYEPDTQTIRTAQRYVRSGRDIRVTQYDFAPKGVAYAGNDNRMVLLKRVILHNAGPAPLDTNVYLYMDPALNGGDDYDFMLRDTVTGAMIAGDNQYRIATHTGPIGPGQEYNPTTFSGYEKDVSVFLATAMKTLSAPGAAGGTLSSDSWRDTSPDNGQGWIGQKVTLPPGQDVEVNFLLVGGFTRPSGQSALPGAGPGVFTTQMAPVIGWFQAGSAAQWQAQTDAFWRSFLADGVQIQIPDQRLQTLFNRGLLATMLHVDEANGGLIAGFRNGAYPYVWPRDMAWAGITLARTGHIPTVEGMVRFLRDIAYRDFETWTPGNTPPVEAAGGVPYYGTRKGFWKQKYTTDGYTVWGAPQVDETAVIPWLIYYHYLVTGDAAFLTEAEPGNPDNSNYEIVKDAAVAMSQTSKNDPTRMNHRPSYPGSSTLMMYSNNVWEDSYDTFIMSNANIVRGLRDAAAIATILGQHADAADFTQRADGILAGITDKLAWNGENTDISLLGIVYPFELFSPVSPQATLVIDRINGVAADRWGNVQPLVRFAGQYINDASDFVGLVDRYWGDTYWGNPALGPTPAGPWFLTTLWYGSYYAKRQNHTPGTGDIDNHLFRLNRTADHNGPIGFGAEQMAPSNSLLYPGQSDFRLQTAWPNAWESMSFYVDALMHFVDYTPDAPGNTLRVRPKLPSSWDAMAYRNLRVGDHRVDIEVGTAPSGAVHTFTNATGNAVNFDTVVRVQAGSPVCFVTVNGATASFTYDSAVGAVSITGPLATGVGAQTVVFVWRFSPADIAQTDATPGPDGQIDNGDFALFVSSFFSADCDGSAVPCNPADIAATDASPGPDGQVDNGDFALFISLFFSGGGCL
jgi:GH15 family glucan-1,4-alpha-glucosidase